MQGTRAGERRQPLAPLRRLATHRGLPDELHEVTLHALGEEIGLNPAESVAGCKRLVREGDAVARAPAGGTGDLHGRGAIVEELL